MELLQLIRELIQIFATLLELLWSMTLNFTRQKMTHQINLRSNPTEINPADKMNDIKIIDIYNLTSFEGDLMNIKRFKIFMINTYPMKIFNQQALAIIPNDMMESQEVQGKRIHMAMLVVDRYEKGKGISMVNNIARGLCNFGYRSVKILNFQRMIKIEVPIKAHVIKGQRDVATKLIHGGAIIPNLQKQEYFEYETYVNQNIEEIDSTQIMVILDREYFYGDALHAWCYEKSVGLDIEDTRSNWLDLSIIWNGMTYRQWSLLMKDKFEQLPVNEATNSERLRQRGPSSIGFLRKGFTMIRNANIELFYEWSRLTLLKERFKTDDKISSLFEEKITQIEEDDYSD